MKNVKMLAVMAVMLISQLGQAQNFKYNVSKTAELSRFALILAEVEVDPLASVVADEALKEWYLKQYEKTLFDYVASEYTCFGKVLTFRESRKPLLNSFDGYRTNIADASMIEVAAQSKFVGTSYMEIYDPKKGKYFGVWLMIFK